MFAILGIRGHGKTYTAYALSKKYPNEYVLIFDANESFPVNSEYYNALDSLDVIEAYERGIKKVRLLMPQVSEIDLLIDYLKEMNNILIVIDEANMVFERRKNNDTLEWIIHIGRHANIGIIMIARRYTNLPIDFTAQAIFVFNQVIEPADIQHIKQRLGTRTIPPKMEKYNWYAAEPDGMLSVLKADYIQDIVERN